MSRGVLLYAMNTPNVDYGRIANVAAILIKRNLGLPVSVITDRRTTVDPGLFDQVIKHKPKLTHSDILQEQGGLWRNKERHDYWNLSPYEQTLVLDSDYLIFNNRYLELFDGQEPLYLSYDAIRTNAKPVKHSELYISPFSLPLIWGTCFYFRKTPEAKLFFDLVEYVRDNYGYFAYQHELVTHWYRNDFTFAIAANLYSDFRKEVIAKNPFKLVTAYTDSSIAKVSASGLTLKGAGEYNGIQYHPHTSIHLLNKQTILDHYEHFKQLAL